MRDNATAWERKTSGCYVFQCHNETGPIYWKQCNKTDEVCENDQCVNNNEVTPYTVVIEIKEKNVTDVNMTEIRSTISNLTGVEIDKLIIRIVVNDKDGTIQIIVFVNDKTTADELSDKINQCASLTNENSNHDNPSRWSLRSTIMK